MGPTETLIALLGALYLSDCWFFVPHAATVFRSPWLREWTHAGSRVRIATQRGQWVLLQVLPPLGRHAVCEPWPLAITPALVVTRADPRVFGSTLQSLAPIALERAREAFALEKRIQVGKHELARAASAGTARRMVELLRELAGLEPRLREQHLVRALRETFDLAALERRREQLARATRPLLLACNALFAYLIAIVPAVLWTFGLTQTWILLLALLIAGQVWVLAAFARAHRELYPEARGERRALLFQASISPPLAVRTIDAAARDAFAQFHPLAVARVLTPGEPFRSQARAALREARFGSTRTALPEGVRSARAWFDERELAELTKWIESAGEEPEQLLRSPAQEGGALAYCPLCDTQFVVAQENCNDCDGVPLVRFRS